MLPGILFLIWFASTIIFVVLMVYAWTQRHQPAGWPLLMVVTMGGLMTGVEVATLLINDPELAIRVNLWVTALPYSLGAVNLFWFVVALRRHPWNHWPVVLPLYGLALLDYSVVATSPLHGWFVTDYSLVAVGGVSFLRLEFGPWFFVRSLFGLALIAIALVLLSLGIRTTRGILQRQQIWVMIGILTPTVGQIAITGVVSQGYFEHTDFNPATTFAIITALCFSFAIQRFRLLDLSPVALPVVFAEIPQGIIVTDPQGRVTDFNAVAAQLARSESVLRVGQPLIAVFPFLGEQVGDHDQSIIDSDGNRRDVTWSVRDLRRDGTLSGRIYLIDDVTRHRQQERALRQAREQAEAANNAKSRFLAHMTHELRSPLNAILGFSELMAQDENLTEKQKNTLATVSYSGKHLLEIINEILDMAKIETGEVELYAREYDLPRMLRDVSRIFTLAVQQKGIRLRVNLASDLPSAVRGDEVKLRQVIINLLSNAVKFTDTGEVHMAARWQASELVLSIQDTGSGIAPADLPRIFEPFRQSTNGHQQGTGLGLSIARHYIELMGGTITVSSQQGDGTTFTLQLPLTVAAEPSASIENHNPIYHVSHSEESYIPGHQDSRQPSVIQAQLRQLDTSLRHRLLVHVGELDVNGAQSVLDEITVTHPDMASALREYIRVYDFDTLERILSDMG